MKRLGKRSYTILSDSGQRHGNDHLAILIGYYDERAGKHITVNLTSDPADKDGESAYEATLHCLRANGITHAPAAQLTDNTGSVMSMGKGLAGFMTRNFGASFVVVGCLCHVLNLTLSTPYIYTFGEQKMNEPSALRLAWIITYLQSKNMDKWGVAWEAITGQLSRKIQEPVLTRWYTVINVFTWVLENQVYLSQQGQVPVRSVLFVPLSSLPRSRIL